ncbi:U7 snRNA-associated Sm-like protein LSm11 [Galleria mellonella]|uniref:U7 snRNA-associated Sm-like protein LSm11 n=1 Tax=Galleria mellonella TaxID=7137 RepID=A0ABM3N5K6_GALME|nr:U7 snRNA-associated Sm-like protein LSm11 [Galleria mellonella]
MSEEANSDSSTSESEISACSSSFNPFKAIYSAKTKIPVQNAPMYENLSQYESAQKGSNTIIPVGQRELVMKREREKEMKKQETQKLLEEKNKQRFAKFQVTAPVRKEKVSHNVLTRIQAMDGPLATLKECVDNRLRIKVITRNETGVRGVLHANLIAFDKQWNLALSDVLEIWKRKAPRKRKIPPGMSMPAAKGSAAAISPVPRITETPLGKGIWECTRHIPQLFVRGEHVVLVNIVER